MRLGSTVLLVLFAATAFLSCPGNNVPDMPAAPDGPAAGYPDSTYAFTVTTTDPDGDSVAYRFSWGGGDTSAWGDLVPSGSTYTLSHVWDSIGSYAVTAQARDSRDAESGWSAEHTTIISERPNHPPETPLPPVGQTDGYPDSTYTYRASPAADPDGDSVAYRISWGDGDTTEWSDYFGPSGYPLWAHSWAETGFYPVRLQARDKLGAESDWSDSLLVSMHPNYPRLLLKTIRVGTSPTEVAVLPNGRYVYVTKGQGEVSAIDTSCDSVVATVVVGGRPFGIGVLPSGEYAYVANNGSRRVSVIRTASNSVVDTIVLPDNARGMDVLPSGEYAYVAMMANKVVVIRTSDNTVVATVTVGISPYAVAATSDGKRVYVTSESDNTLAVISAEDNSLEATIPVGEVPYGVAAVPSGEYVYVSNSNSDNVMMIRTSDNVVADTVAVSGYPIGLAVSPDGEYLYVARSWDESVSVVRTADNKIVHTVAVPGQPSELTFLPDGSQVYVTLFESSEVAVIGY